VPEKAHDKVIIFSMCKKKAHGELRLRRVSKKRMTNYQAHNQLRVSGSAPNHIAAIVVTIVRRLFLYRKNVGVDVGYS
jgi:hypothetical protein